MADYDKRYNSVEEMLLDVEAVLCSNDVSGVRPADLPSVNGQTQKPNNTKESVRRLPDRTTPSTGGGPFLPKKYKTKPLGLMVLLIIFVTGAILTMDNNNRGADPVEQATEVHPPDGRVLVLNELSATHNNQAKKVASNKITSLGISGWDFFTDTSTEASVRSWLPSDPIGTTIQPNRFEDENISGILLILEGEYDNPAIYFIDKSGSVLIQ
jgi:hypothetical protein